MAQVARHIHSAWPKRRRALTRQIIGSVTATSQVMSQPHMCSSWAPNGDKNKDFVDVIMNRSSRGRLRSWTAYCTAVNNKPIDGPPTACARVGKVRADFVSTVMSTISCWRWKQTTKWKASDTVPPINPRRPNIYGINTVEDDTQYVPIMKLAPSLDRLFCAKILELLSLVNKGRYSSTPHSLSFSRQHSLAINLEGSVNGSC